MCECRDSSPAPVQYLDRHYGYYPVEKQSHGSGVTGLGYNLLFCDTEGILLFVAVPGGRRFLFPASTFLRGPEQFAITFLLPTPPPPPTMHWQYTHARCDSGT